jgi:hypothetical protein
MKKLFFRAGVTVLMTALISSCAKETVETPGDNFNRTIAYKAAFGANKPVAGTRAAEVNVDDLIDNNAMLPVWVYFRTGTSADNLFKSWSLTYLDAPVGHWSYNNDVDEIHPQDALMHFSVWPVANVTTESQDAQGNMILDNVDTTSDDATFDYTVPALHSAQEDLLVARANSTYAMPQAQFTYHHALSQINFAVKGYPGVKITIGGIEMGGIYNKGTYSFGTDKWSGLEGDGAYNYAIATAQSGSTTGLDDKEVLFGDGDNSLMLLPQSFVENTAAWFSFDYVLTNMDGVVLKSGADVKVALKDLAPVWENGSRYRYTIQFNELNTISYAVQVNPWKVEDQAPVVQ